MNSNSMICAALAPDTQFFVKAGDPRPHIITKCRGQPLICLYDTGSSPSLIKRQVLSELENAAGCTFPKRDTQVRCTGAFEGSVQATQKVMLDIAAGGRKVSQEFLISDKLSSGAIMGSALIKKLGLRWDPTMPEQLLQADEEDVRLASTVTIPAGASIVATCHLGGAGGGADFVAEPIQDGPCDLP